MMLRHDQSVFIKFQSNLESCAIEVNGLYVTSDKNIFSLEETSKTLLAGHCSPTPQSTLCLCPSSATLDCDLCQSSQHQVNLQRSMAVLFLFIY